MSVSITVTKYTNRTARLDVYVQYVQILCIIKVQSNGPDRDLKVACVG